MITHILIVKFPGCRQETNCMKCRLSITIHVHPKTSEPKSNSFFRLSCIFLHFMLFTNPYGLSRKMVRRLRWPYTYTKCRINPLELGIPHFHIKPCILEGLVP